MHKVGDIIFEGDYGIDNVEMKVDTLKNRERFEIISIDETQCFYRGNGVTLKSISTGIITKESQHYVSECYTCKTFVDEELLPVKENIDALIKACEESNL